MYLRCWLKDQRDPAAPSVNMRGAYTANPNPTLALTLALTLTLTLTLNRRVHGQVPRAPGTPPRAAERALDQRHHQGPGGEAQDQWHVERQGSLVKSVDGRTPSVLIYR